MAKSSDNSGLDRILTLEIVRVTERAAVAAARLRGRGDEKEADQVAVDAMRKELKESREDTEDRMKRYLEKDQFKEFKAVQEEIYDEMLARANADD